MILWLRLLFSSLSLLERQASEYGMVTLQQMHRINGLGWFCSIRAHEGAGRPRYSWTASDDTLKGALYACIREASGNPIQAIVGTPCVPRLGTQEFDDE